MANDKQPELAKTLPVSRQELEDMRLAEGVRSLERQLSLVIYHRDGVRAVPLMEGASVVVGARIQPT